MVIFYCNPFFIKVINILNSINLMVYDNNQEHLLYMYYEMVLKHVKNYDHHSFHLQLL